MREPDISRDAAWSAVVAEAAAWIALLHGPDRTPAVERGLKRWLAEDPLHARAFELATETWHQSRAAVKRAVKVKLILPHERGPAERYTAARLRPWLYAIGCMLTLALALFATHELMIGEQAYETSVGERRTLMLEDGTQVTLNTDSRLVIRYDEHQRRVLLESGEALFEVARRPAWPFIVSASGRDITALGTSFVVRNVDDQLAVTLIEGKVAVAKHAMPQSRPAAPSLPGEAAAAAVLTLAPGERATYGRAAGVAVDRPQLRRITAWQTGKVDLEDISLADAIEEMNRYSSVQLEVQGDEAAALRIGGIFKAGDSASFAAAVARTHGLNMEREDRRIVLSGVPFSMRATQ
jgi:transmembrane sensor